MDFDRAVALGVKLTELLENLKRNQTGLVGKEIQEVIDQMCQIGYTQLVREILEDHGFTKETTVFVIGDEGSDGF